MVDKFVIGVAFAVGLSAVAAVLVNMAHKSRSGHRRGSKFAQRYIGSWRK